MVLAGVAAISPYTAESDEESKCKNFSFKDGEQCVLVGRKQIFQGTQCLASRLHRMTSELLDNPEDRVSVQKVVDAVIMHTNMTLLLGVALESDDCTTVRVGGDQVAVEVESCSDD
jgi:hypothetical protein